MKKNKLSRNDRKIVQNLSLAIKYFAQQQENYFLHDLWSYHDVFFAELAEEALRKERAKYIWDLYSKKEKKWPCKIYLRWLEDLENWFI